MKTKSDKKEITINSVEIEIAGTKIKLTLEQVAELKKILDKAFPEPKTNTVYVPGPERIIHRPMPIPHWLIQPEPARPKWDEWRVICKTGTSAAAVMQLKATH